MRRLLSEVDLIGTAFYAERDFYGTTVEIYLFLEKAISSSMVGYCKVGGLHLHDIVYVSPFSLHIM